MRLTRLPTRWWLPLLLAGILTTAWGSSGPRQDQAPESPTYEAEAFVLDDPGRDPVMCLGSFADSLPPQCDGTPLAGWDWGSVEGEETARRSTWGSFHLVGSYDGTTFTVLEAGPPKPPDASGGDPVDAACAQADGGWTSPDISKTSDADVRDLMRAMEDEPDFAGLWIDYVAEPVGEAPSSRAGSSRTSRSRAI
jgi:hypothetical protein